MLTNIHSRIKSDPIKLTQYSHGAGCGCKISPQILDAILKSNLSVPDNKLLLVGNNTKDDAAVYDLQNGTALISTTDFFMPIVDDPYEFGRIASANAISDVYAMGGKPVLAIAILGWPVNKLAPEIAQQVIEGSRSICKEAGIALAGGHSIDSPEPIFGLAVNGLIQKDHIKQNNNAQLGDLLFLTKPLGVGILTTAEKKGLLLGKDKGIAAKQMMQLNSIGVELGKLPSVHAMTDVTGFGLLGHLLEMTEGSKVSAQIYFESIPLIIGSLKTYVDSGCIPGGTVRNWDSYSQKIGAITDYQKSVLADPQTSGGLLFSVAPEFEQQVQRILIKNGLEKFSKSIGRITPENETRISLT
ncbi:MAG: selenide, water dikinase SelD [Ginsengibacter sp.]